MVWSIMLKLPVLGQPNDLFASKNFSFPFHLSFVQFFVGPTVWLNTNISKIEKYICGRCTLSRCVAGINVSFSSVLSSVHQKNSCSEIDSELLALCIVHQTNHILANNIQVFRLPLYAIICIYDIIIALNTFSPLQITKHSNKSAIIKQTQITEFQ